MENIKVKILNPEALGHIQKMVAFTARLTQRGHELKSMDDCIDLYNKPCKSLKTFCSLPHPTLQKFGTIDILVFGASRRFLAQITRHQNEVKFMSASLQYSDYSGNADFVVPEGVNKELYLKSCQNSMDNYQALINEGVDNDTAGYLTPQALRNILVISATPYQWKYMINQRICNRNTRETQYIMELIWKELSQYELFQYGMGPDCWLGGCREGKMSCGERYELP